MKPDEIRRIGIVGAGLPEMVQCLREIAAQIAELNEQLRQQVTVIANTYKMN